LTRPRPTSVKGEEPFFARVYRLVRSIPKGRVVTYGQVAEILGTPRGARAVGWALRGLDPRREPLVPWHRVVGSGGRISLREGPGGLLQRRRLRAEGVRFRNGRVDLTRHGLQAAWKAVAASRVPARVSRGRRGAAAGRELPARAGR
jgi:methylated-DNA-protein-cysteine methyltransferase related protein